MGCLGERSTEPDLKLHMTWKSHIHFHSGSLCMRELTENQIDGSTEAESAQKKSATGCPTRSSENEDGSRGRLQVSRGNPVKTRICEQRPSDLEAGASDQPIEQRAHDSDCSYSYLLLQTVEQ